MKRQQFLEIQDGGNHHREFLQLVLDVIDIFWIEVPMFPLILVTINGK